MGGIAQRLRALDARVGGSTTVTPGFYARMFLVIGLVQVAAGSLLLAIGVPGVGFLLLGAGIGELTGAYVAHRRARRQGDLH